MTHDDFLPDSDPATCSLRNLRRRIYACNIQGRGGTKITDLKTRTADADFIVLSETNSRKGDENSINLGCKAVAIADIEDKGLAYGTAVMSRGFDANSDKISYRSERFEIVSITQKVSETVTCTIVGGYRSPNMRADDTLAFHEDLRKILNI